MALLPFGEYRPDCSDYEGQATQNILNVAPRGDGYGPFRDYAALSQALIAACRGSFYALKSDGSIALFAGTSDRLWLASNTDYSWTPVSKVTTVTFTGGGSPNVSLASHGFAANDPVVFSNSGGGLPAAITAGTKYYVKTIVDANTFTVSATAGGAAINMATAGTGTHSVTWLYTAVSTDEQWRFAQFGNLVFATQKNTVLQVYNLSSSSAFADCSGSPPQASYISVVGRFLVLSGLLSNPFRVHWSGLNDTTNWTSGVGSSDYQDFPDGGIVRGVAGGEFGTVFQDQAIRRMSYIPGSALIFQIERITQDQGLFASGSVVAAGDIVYFHSAHGFHKIAPGGFPEQIGRERVDRTFFDDLDKTELRMFIGAYDPRTTRVFWAYKSTSGTTGQYDKILGYDTALDRWFPIEMSGEYLLGMSQPGVTLENLDSISSSIDALGASLDAFAVSTQPLIAQFNTDHKIGFFSGSNLEATLETAEQGADGEQIYGNGFRPVTDAPTVYGSLSYRNLPSETPTSLPEILRNSRTGNFDLRRSTKFSRMKIRIPSATLWTYAAGVHPTIKPDGKT